jgi:hypothetical protein
MGGSKALIAITSYTNDKINNAATAHFNKQNEQLFNGFGIIPNTKKTG